MAKTAETVTDEHVARKYLAILHKCNENNIPFDLSLTDVRKLLSRKTCAYTGVKIQPMLISPGEKQAWNSLTIDRIEPRLGYVKGNVVACSYRTNQKKGNLTREFIEQLYKVVCQ